MRTQLRDEILRAAIEIIAERGFRDASSASVIERAQVSRAAFYKLFGGVEDCLRAVLDEALSHATALVESAFSRTRTWEEGMRDSLAAILCFLDSEPAVARVLLVETLASGSAYWNIAKTLSRLFGRSSSDRSKIRCPTLGRWLPRACWLRFLACFTLAWRRESVSRCSSCSAR